MFEEMITVGSACEKGEKINEIAAGENVSLENCELIEDTFKTLLDVMGDGIKVKHISELVADWQ